jgi:hypothetical protein
MGKEGHRYDWEAFQKGKHFALGSCPLLFVVSGKTCIMAWLSALVQCFLEGLSPLLLQQA